MKKPKKLKYLFFVLTIINLIVWILFFSITNKSFSISFLNVGNGDGILIETPDDFRIVIDGGPSDKILSKIGLSRPLSKKEIDLLILTHPHEDHVFGALEIVKNYQVKKIVTSGVVYTNPSYLSLLEEIKNKNIPHQVAFNGQVYKLGDLEIKIIYPFSDISGKKVANLNDSSLVFKIRYGKFSALFLGDIEEKAGLEILKQGINLKADVVKVSHQGAKNGAQNLPFFLERISPKLAIISVGENRFGHPSQKTLERLNNLNVKVLRTDKDGDITIFSDKDNFWF